MKLEKKEVRFNGSKILTVKENGKIYVGISYVCYSVGMSEDQKRRQIKKVQEDDTLKIGVKKLSVNFDTQVREQIFIELDYLPLWLAKINPARFSDKLKKRLLDYQLHAKDVLASAFLDKPKQLSLPVVKEHKIIKKYYNSVPVMSVLDLATIVGRNRTRVLALAPKNKTMIHKYEMAKFKEENPNLPNALVHMSILYREEVINICKKLKVYDKVKPQISAYFDEITPEVNIVSGELEKASVNENIKVELLLKALPHLSEEKLKNHVAIEVIKLVDNKILEEYENGRLSMRFIDSTEKILEVREINGYRITAVATDKPIEKVMEPGLFIGGTDGLKIITEKIK